MRINDIKQYNKILILGYGKEGRASREFLNKFVPEAKIGIADQKDGPNYLEKQKEYDLVIKTPGISKNLVTIPYTTATNIFFANCSGQIIGVTGSKGKSTTASLIQAILKNAGKKVKLCGNIGQPMLSEFINDNKYDGIFVCELSSYQLDDIKYSPHISVITSLFPEHMNYHGDCGNYYLAKKNILAHAKGDDYFIYHPQYPQLRQWANESVCIGQPAKRTIRLHGLANPLIGKHNLQNIDCAATVAKIFNIGDEIIKKAVANFRPLPHRLQFVGKFKDILFYDDAISTTPQSTICAITSFPKIGTLFLGGLDRGYDFDELSRVIIDKKIPNIVLFPESGEKIKKLLKEKNYSSQIFETQSMEEAVDFAYSHTPVNTVCLLSTASPSYSLWKNFEEKGEQFQFYIKKNK